MLDWTYREIPDEVPLHITSSIEAYALWLDQFDEDDDDG